MNPIAAWEVSGSPFLVFYLYYEGVAYLNVA